MVFMRRYEEIKMNSQSIKDTKASFKYKNDELKDKHATALKSLKETNISKVNSLENSLKIRTKAFQNWKKM